MSLTIRDIGPIFDLSRDAVVGVSEDLIVFANPVAQSLYPIRPGDKAEAYLPAHILEETSASFTATGKMGGQTVDFSVSCAGSDRIISIRSRHESRNSFSGKSRALNEMGSDLLTVRLALDAIVQGSHVEEDQKLSQYAAALYQSFYRLKRLHSHMSLTECIRNENLPFRPRLCDLVPLCGDLCGTVASLVRDLDISLLFEGPNAPCFILGDAGLIETMLLNLLSNSLLHTEKGGMVRVTLTQQGRRFVIAVDDQGGGIPGARIADLFSDGSDAPLSEPAGVGYGLFIVRGIAEKHGGTLMAESREGAGTLLRVSLPAAEPKDIRELHQPEIEYRSDGMNAILTELSVVLDKSIYTRKSFD